MSHAALLLALALAADAPRADGPDVAGAVAEVMAGARDAVRVALPPVVVDAPQGAAEATRAEAIEKALVRALVDRRREEVVTPAYMRAKLKAQGEAALRDVGAEALRPFACDHVLLAEVGAEEGRAVLRLRLVLSETGEVLGTATAPLDSAHAEAGAAGAGTRGVGSARGVRAAVDDLVADIAWSIEASGEALRLHRTAVTPMDADEAARAGRLDRYVESELARALERRGLLVVERTALDAALEQQAVGQLLDEQSAPRVGQALGAQSLVVGTIAATGTVFTVSVRVIGTETGAVLGASAASLARDDVVAIAAVETRTPLEAAVRSAVAPGWGQAYNQQGAKAVVFAVAGYGGLVTAAGLGVGGVLAHARYSDVAAVDALPPAEREKAVSDAKALGNGLYLSAWLAGVATAGVWSLGIVDAVLDAPSSAGGE